MTTQQAYLLSKLLQITGETIEDEISPQFELIGIDKPDIPDATIKVLFKNLQNQPVAVGLCSSVKEPAMVQRNIEYASLAQQALGKELGHIVINPLATGDIEGISYGIFPYCQPLSNSRLWWQIQKLQISPAILQILSDVNRITVSAVPSAEVEETFAKSLQYLVDSSVIPEPLPQLSKNALDQLFKGIWHPYYVLMHNDLWKGNILLRKSRDQNTQNNLFNHSIGSKIVIIDWAGSLVKGYPIYDLIRIAQSLKLSDRQLLNNLKKHSQILNCQLEESLFYLLTALGYLGIHREEFPLERFIKLSVDCLQTWQRIHSINK
jgi:hypothetical protein